MNEKLTQKEELFCINYINCGNAKEAAMTAGFKDAPEKKCAKLLGNPKISKKIERLFEEKKRKLVYKACIGYERLAFGSISDSIKLLFKENLDCDTLESMDLFNISEIKKPKDGAMEIKFFDRIKALEKLEQSDFCKDGGADPFYYALEKGMAALKEDADKE